MRFNRRPSLPDRWRAVTAFTVGLFLSLAVACAVQAQSDTTHVLSDSARDAAYARVDSLLTQADSILRDVPTFPAEPVILQSKVETVWRIRSYGLAIAAGLVANEVFRIDLDRCPTGKRFCFSTYYHDQWIARDKFDHFEASYFLTNSAMQFGVPDGWAFALTCGLAGPGFEVTQRGYISRKDIAADCVGSAVAVGLRHALTAMRGEGWLHLHR